jgi:hypothetical protein
MKKSRFSLGGGETLSFETINLKGGDAIQRSSNKKSGQIHQFIY